MSVVENDPSCMSVNIPRMRPHAAPIQLYMYRNSVTLSEDVFRVGILSTVADLELLLPEYLR